MLLAGIAAVLLAFGKFDYLGWITRGQHVHPHLLPGQASAGQRALVKFFVVVALLFLAQTLVGGAVAHYRADPGSFYGFHLERIFPSNLMRTWHLQTGDLLDRHRLRRRRACSSAARCAPTSHAGSPAGCTCCSPRSSLVIGGSLLGEWLGMSQLLGRLVVLARQPGLGIPGARPAVAVPAGGRFAGVVRAAVVAGAAARGG